MKNPFNEKETILAKKALRSGIIGRAELKRCADIKRRQPERPLVAIMLSEGMISEEDLSRLVDAETGLEAVTVKKGATGRAQRTVAEEIQPPVGAETIRIGKYRVVGLIGEGGMGKVYKAFDEDLHRYVAIKVMLPSMVGDEDAVRRFLLEAESAAKLNHPNIIPIYEVGREEDIFYLVMEFVEGETLNRFVRKKKRPSRVRLLRIVRDVCLAVHYAHINGIIHRDLKSSNIMVARDGTVRVMDFGLAKRITAERDASLKTKEGVLLGTPEYMPPEQAEGKISEIDVRSDVYSLGVIMYELFTKSLPFTGSSIYEVCRKVFFEEPERPSRLNPEVDWELETIILKAMEKKKEERYQSAKELADEIGRYLRGEPLKAAKAGWWYFTRKKIMRNKPFYAAVGVSVLALLLLGAWFIIAQLRAAEQIRRERDEAIRQARIAEQERSKAEEAKLAAERARVNEERMRIKAEEALVAAEEARRKEEQMRRELQKVLAESLFQQAKMLYHQKNFREAEKIAAKAFKQSNTVWADYLYRLSSSRGYRLFKKFNLNKQILKGFFVDDETLLLLPADFSSPIVLNTVTGEKEVLNELVKVTPAAVFLKKEGMFYALTSDNYCLKYSIKRRKLLWKKRLKGGGCNIAATKEYVVIRGIKLSVLDAKNGEVLAQKEVGSSGAIAVSGNGKTLLALFGYAVRGGGGIAKPARISFYTLPNLSEVKTVSLVPPEAIPYLISLSPSSLVAVTSMSPSEMLVYDVEREFLLARLPVLGGGSAVPGSGFINDELIVTASSTREVALWDARDFTLKERFLLDCEMVHSVLASPDGSLIVLLGTRPEVALFRPSDEKVERSFTLRSETLSPFVNRTTVSHGGEYIVLAGSDGVVNLFDVATGRLVQKTKDPTGRRFAPLYGVAFSEDDKTLFLGDGYGNIAALEVPSLHTLWCKSISERLIWKIVERAPCGRYRRLLRHFSERRLGEEAFPFRKDTSPTSRYGAR